jgi:hypothetical protein
MDKKLAVLGEDGKMKENLYDHLKKYYIDILNLPLGRCIFWLLRPVVPAGQK